MKPPSQTWPNKPRLAAPRPSKFRRGFRLNPSPLVASAKTFGKVCVRSFHFYPLSRWSAVRRCPRRLLGSSTRRTAILSSSKRTERCGGRRRRRRVIDWCSLVSRLQRRKIRLSCRWWCLLRLRFFTRSWFSRPILPELHSIGAKTCRRRSESVLQNMCAINKTPSKAPEPTSGTVAHSCRARRRDSLSHG